MFAEVLGVAGQPAQRDRLTAVARVHSLFDVRATHPLGRQGQARRSGRLGMSVCVVKDQHQFLLHHKLLGEGGELDIAEPIIEKMQELFPGLRACSLGRNLHSPENRIKMDRLLDLNALPAKGRLSAARCGREAGESLRKPRRQHSAVEAAIHHLEHHRLNRVRTMGQSGC